MKSYDQISHIVCFWLEMECLQDCLVTQIGTKKKRYSLWECLEMAQLNVWVFLVPYPNWPRFVISTSSGIEISNFLSVKFLQSMALILSSSFIDWNGGVWIWQIWQSDQLYGITYTVLSFPAFWRSILFIIFTVFSILKLLTIYGGILKSSYPDQRIKKSNVWSGFEK